MMDKRLSLQGGNRLPASRLFASPSDTLSAAIRGDDAGSAIRLEECRAGAVGFNQTFRRYLVILS